MTPDVTSSIAGTRPYLVLGLLAFSVVLFVYDGPEMSDLPLLLISCMLLAGTVQTRAKTPRAAKGWGWTASMLTLAGFAVLAAGGMLRKIHRWIEVGPSTIYETSSLAP